MSDVYAMKDSRGMAVLSLILIAWIPPIVSVWYVEWFLPTASVWDHTYYEYHHNNEQKYPGYGEKPGRHEIHAHLVWIYFPVTFNAISAYALYSPVVVSGFQVKACICLLQV